MDKPTWYYYLVKKDINDTKQRRGKALLDVYGSEDLSRRIVIQSETYNGGRMYAVFDSHIKFYNYLLSINEENRRFHEVVLDGMCQKPRFDIDIKRSELPPDTVDLDGFAEEIKDRVITAAIAVLSEHKVEIDLTKNIIVCSSHGLMHDGDEKRSFHIIIDGYIHGCSEEALAFFEQVSKVIEDPEVTLKYLDGGIYSKNHSLRVLWCYKLHDPRIKSFERSYMYQGDTYTHNTKRPHTCDDDYQLMVLEASLITFISGAEMLPIFELEGKRRWDDSIVLTESDAGLAFGMLKEKLVVSRGTTGSGDTGSAFPFTISSVKGGLIALERKHPSYCQVCDKVHDHVHPYMFIAGGNVFYHCRRAARGHKVLLGTIPHLVSGGAQSWALKTISKLSGSGCDAIQLLQQDISIQSQPVELEHSVPTQEQLTHSGPVTPDLIFNLQLPVVPQPSFNALNPGTRISRTDDIVSIPVPKKRWKKTPVGSDSTKGRAGDWWDRSA